MWRWSNASPAMSWWPRRSPRRIPAISATSWERSSKRGVRGLILGAGCRDIDDLEAMGFPVWSRSISAHGTVKETLGDVNVPVSCGDALVTPGDVIVADNDGVVVVPRLKATAVASAAQARIEKEEASRARYLTGELGLDLNNMRPKLKARGLTYVTQADWDADR